MTVGSRSGRAYDRLSGCCYRCQCGAKTVVFPDLQLQPATGHVPDLQLQPATGHVPDLLRAFSFTTTTLATTPGVARSVSSTPTKTATMTHSFEFRNTLNVKSQLSAIVRKKSGRQNNNSEAWGSHP
ncbi:uncharacterized protein [Lolium perenne]|uniref:uncharacterized protein n=1 Tax=Lolium perenne TaxID=4522 RepID=UPI003A99E7CE